MERRRQRDQIPAADSVPVSVYRGTGGLGISGSGGADRGSYDVAFRATGQELHPAAFGVRIRRAGYHGDPDDRKQARSYRDYFDRAFHDMLGEAAGVPAGDRGFHSAQFLVSGDRAARTVRVGIRGGDSDGAAAEIECAAQQTIELHAGDASLSLAHATVAGSAADRPVESVSAARWYRDSGRSDCDLAAMLLAVF